MMIHTFKPDLAVILTTMLVGVSITMINSVITTVILLLTALYWGQKNWRIYKNKDKDDLK